MKLVDNDENVVILPVVTTLGVPVDRVLNGAVKTHSEKPFKRVLLIGYHEDGTEFFASSDSDGGTALWDMERARHKLMKTADDLKNS